MKTLSKEHRANLSRANKITWARKNHLQLYLGEANRKDVINVVKGIICSNCDEETKTRCDKVVWEHARNGRLIRCILQRQSVLKGEPHS